MWRNCLLFLFLFSLLHTENVSLHAEQLKVIEELNPEDLALIDYAKEKLKQGFVKDKHFVLAAMKGKSGKIYTGFNLKTIATRASVCAESIALGKAIEEGEEVELLVVVAYVNNQDHISIVSPCGICRELLYDYVPHIQLILHLEEKLVKRTLKEMFLFPYKRY